MIERLFQRLGHRYVLVVFLVTRLVGLVGGMGVIYYLELTLTLPSPLREHFRLYSAIVCLFSSTVTVFVALWETRHLKQVLIDLERGKAISLKDAKRGGHEAATFVNRHHLFEAWWVPLSCYVPDMLCLWVFDNASATVLVNLTLTVFIAIVMALMSTYFVLEYCMQPVLHYLLDRGVAIDFDAIPRGQLRRRLGLSFALIILSTALMIGTLARQRATDIVADPWNQEAAVQSLRTHSLAITLAAVGIGIIYSTVLADSVASRVRRMIDAMNRVAHGCLTERLQPIGNDEIDVLARHFNTMVRELQHNDHTIRDLNLNLRDRVRERTAQLESTIEELRETQSQLTDVAHRAGMAEVATGVLHNVGNVLNSVNISVSILKEQIRRSKVSDLQAFTARLADQGESLSQFLAAENRGPKLLEFLQRVSGRLAAEHDDVLRETAGLAHKIEHIKGIINAQQAYARQVPFREKVQLGQLIDDVLKLHSESLRKHDIDVVLAIEEVPTLDLEKAKLLQVIDNLVKNAVESIVQHQAATRRITISVSTPTPSLVTISVSDTGGGIRSEDIDKLFRYGFTTKSNGNGFGLHASALAVGSAGGKISAESPGFGGGATFRIDLPLPDTAAAEVGPAADAASEPGEELVCV